MHGSTVVLTSLFTSVLTTTGTMYVIEHYGILSHKEAVVETTVPDLKGLPETDARANAAAAHIALLIAAREPSPDAKPGTVVRQSAPAGQHVPHEYSMSVVLAEEVPRVPSLSGLTEAEAKQRLEQHGYQGDDVMVPSESVQQGLVVEQAPKADVALAKGGVVKVQVSSGQDVVEVPKLVGNPIAQAQATLEKLSLKPIVRWISQGETPAYVVLSQKPAAAEKVKPGTEVTLTVCR
jgi:serine/threonine-protein kinase